MVKKKIPLLYKPQEDGYTHINILAGKAATLVGKRLSHFAQSPFIHPYYGAFQSMEGYWHYVSTGFMHEELRGLSGLTAKRFGRGLRKSLHLDFCEDILAGNYQKIIQSDRLAQMVVESELPFTHYYVFHGSDDNDDFKVIVPRESSWLTEGLDKIRAALKAGEVPECWKNAALRYAQNVASGVPPQGIYTPPPKLEPDVEA